MKEKCKKKKRKEKQAPFEKCCNFYPSYFRMLFKKALFAIIYLCKLLKLPNC